MPRFRVAGDCIPPAGVLPKVVRTVVGAIGTGRGLIVRATIGLAIVAATILGGSK